MKPRFLLNAIVTGLVVLCLSFRALSQEVTIGCVGDPELCKKPTKQVLIQGSQKLVLDPGRGKCDLTLKVSDKTKILKLSGEIRGHHDVENICKEGYTLNLVKQIDQCYDNEPLNRIEGCFYNGCAVVVWDEDTPENESLFLHELAHTRGLQHVCADDYLMNPVLAGAQYTVSNDECRQLKASPWADGEPKPTAELSETEHLSAVNFLKRHYVHGLPFAHVLRFSSRELDDVGAQLQMLVKEDLKTKEGFKARENFEANAVLSLGVAGGADAEKIILSVLNERTGESEKYVEASSVVLLALSYLQHRTQLSDAGLTVLTKGVDPSFWTKKNGHLTIGQSEELAKSTIRAVGNLRNQNGLDVSVILNRLLSQPGDFFQSGYVKALITTSLAFNSKFLPTIPF